MKANLTKEVLIMNLQQWADKGMSFDTYVNEMQSKPIRATTHLQ